MSLEIWFVNNIRVIGFNLVLKQTVPIHFTYTICWFMVMQLKLWKYFMGYNPRNMHTLCVNQLILTMLHFNLSLPNYPIVLLRRLILVCFCVTHFTYNFEMTTFRFHWYVPWNINTVCYALFCCDYFLSYTYIYIYIHISWWVYYYMIDLNKLLDVVSVTVG